MSSPTSSGRRFRRHDSTDSMRAFERPRSAEMLRTPEAGTGIPAVEEVVPKERSEQAARIFNVTLATAGLMATTPVLLLIAIAIKLTSRGPIFYAQTRVGLDRRWRETLALHERRQQDLGGRVFTIYKFRTMRVDAEQRSGAVWAKENDPRVTRLGTFLRKFRFDELPQLFNVIVGDMNIVGPRPERPSIVARLREDIAEYPFRHRVKPGITGLAQINQKYDSCLDDVRAKVRYDLEYLRRQSLLQDTVIMIRTIPAVMLKLRGW